MLNVLNDTTTTTPATIADFFTAAGQTVTGLISGAANVFNGLWSSGAPGQLACTMGLASTIIGLGFVIFKIRGRKRAR